MKYFLYARKSTDAEDKQVLSIEAQLAELKEYARREELEIVDVLVESKTAKKPGRPIFAEMLSRIEAGEANGIIAWNPDRLARNAVDGGHIINLIDTGKLRSLKFPTYWFEPSSQGLFMLQIAFGQAKYYIDNLSENVKRGLRQKVRRGEYPSRAPLGYMNDLRTHTIKIDRKTAPAVRKLFSLYADGNHTLEDLAAAARELGVVSYYKRETVPLSVIHRMLTNPFYIGLFRFNGELHEGIHEPLIDKATFDVVQRTIKERGRPREQPDDHTYPYRKVFTCGECGRCITQEKHTKKSGLVFRYYRCTKKGTQCSQPYLNETKLHQQVSKIISNVALSETWAEKMLQQVAAWEKEEAHASARAAEETKDKLTTVRKRLSKLLDAHLDGLLDREEYQDKKAELLNKKLSLEQSLGRTGHQWLEPLKKWINEAHHAQKLAFSENEAEKAAFLRRIGSNHHLERGEIKIKLKAPWRLAAAAQHSAGRAANSAPSFAKATAGKSASKRERAAGRSERLEKKRFLGWQPHGESNPDFWREKPMS